MTQKFQSGHIFQLFLCVLHFPKLIFIVLLLTQNIMGSRHHLPTQQLQLIFIQTVCYSVSKLPVSAQHCEGSCTASLNSPSYQIAFCSFYESKVYHQASTSSISTVLALPSVSCQPAAITYSLEGAAILFPIKRPINQNLNKVLQGCNSLLTIEYSFCKQWSVTLEE